MDSHKYSTQVERLEVIETGRRRRWSDDEKLRIVIESLQTPPAISSTARRHGISRSLLTRWQRSFRPEPMRTVMDAILYIASTGCQWRQLPKYFPPYSTVQGYFYAWSRGGLFASLNYTLVMASREAAGREASPTAGVIDSQSVKTTESGGPRGYDAGKKIKGRKRHIVTDTQGNLVGLIVHEASIQDRDGAPCVLASIRYRYPWLRHIFADGGYAGDKLRQALRRIGEWTIEIIKRSDRAQGFEILPRRWVVERTFGWLGRCRRLAKDFETTIASAVAWTFVAHIRVLTRRLARA